jgi:16S rRNA (uracil1498-N3)-methyltransferase
MRRFLVGPVTPGTEVELPPGEAKHAVRSLRLESGAAVALFDGAGTEWDGEIVRVAGSRVIVRVGKPRQAVVARRFVIAVAAPKGSRLDWMVEKLAELGAAEILFVRFVRGIVPVGEAKRARIERLAAAAAKQSGRAMVPTAREIAFPELLGIVNERGRLASPGAEQTLAQSGAADLVVIGPEGGVTAEEEAALTGRGVGRVSLGSTILRVETAAVAAAAVLAQL